MCANHKEFIPEYFTFDCTTHSEEVQTYISAGKCQNILIFTEHVLMYLVLTVSTFEVVPSAESVYLHF